jgi:hypothetical protein
MTPTIQSFFADSDWVDRFVLRPLSHIRPNWELAWDSESSEYFPEADSFAELLNLLIREIADTPPPSRYHDNEDILATHVQLKLNWGIRQRGKTWVNADGNRLGPDDYVVLLEQGEFHSVDQTELIAAASGRIHAAIARGQTHLDEMELSHRYILAGVLSAILYHRADD